MLDYHIKQVEELMTEHGNTVGNDFSGHEVLEAARKYAASLNGDQKPVPINEHLRRWEDMGQGRLELFREEDGDMIVTVIDPEGHSSSVQFCTYGSGGGQSPKVLKALYTLASAILEENQSHPQRERGPALAGR
ncbi:hypothetical protein RBE51_20805 [Pseudomonas taiwanensis]|uniref:hypothetical protein n=1 Tax=Pseudomonas taiwanensis TaxID=470150 RepID=UPI0028DEA49F|nr:hypothetical protein [Pseudomonas taiwanensis]MDT8925237.1 hypothetical protein [Pseudomonas taiwanensis]